VQHVPGLQCIVRPVRRHPPGERDPQVEGEQPHADGDRRRRRQQVMYPAVSGAGWTRGRGRRQPGVPGIERICIRWDPLAPGHGSNLLRTCRCRTAPGTVVNRDSLDLRSVIGAAQRRRYGASSLPVSARPAGRGRPVLRFFGHVRSLGAIAIPRAQGERSSLEKCAAHVIGGSSRLRPRPGQVRRRAAMRSGPRCQEPSRQTA